MASSAESFPLQESGGKRHSKRDRRARDGKNQTLPSSHDLITKPCVVETGGSAGQAEHSEGRDSGGNTRPLSPPEDAVEVQLERLRCILAATHALFGEVVLGPAERYPDENLLLAAIAEAHTKRILLRRPARVVFSNLKNGVLPAQEYLDDPFAHLPAEFLYQAGLASGDEARTKRLSVGGWVETGSVLVGTVRRAGQPLPDSSVDLPVIVSIDGEPAGAGEAIPTRSARWAWQMVRNALLPEMRQPTYERYVAVLELVSFNPAECTFTLLAPDERVHRWAEARLTTTLKRLLSGACRRPAKVVVTYPGYREAGR